jgi:two-component sensor histidine kinase
LIVGENGIGLRADVDWETVGSLGLRLVRTLAEQLGAKIEVKLKAGTEVQLVSRATA